MLIIRGDLEVTLGPGESIDVVSPSDGNTVLRLSISPTTGEGDIELVGAARTPTEI